MARYKPCNYDQRLFLPVCLEKQIEEHTLEWMIFNMVESVIDTSVMDTMFKNDDTGRRAYDPKMLLKVILLAYSKGINTSRRIEMCCKENVIFMAMACGQQPDHSTIASFMQALGMGRITSIFRDILMVCEEEGLLGNTHFSLDGVKLPSNASKRMSGTHAQLKAKSDKLEHRIKGLIKSHARADRREAKKTKKDLGEEEEQRQEKQLKRLKDRSNRIKKFLQEEAPRMGRMDKEIKSNVTDPESALMSTEHGVLQGYNAQAMVDNKHQVIVHAEAYGNSQDHGNLGPMVDGTNENLKKIGNEEGLTGKELSADANYHNKEALKKCEEEGIDGYIPDTRFRKRDERFKDRDKYKERHRRDHGSNLYQQRDFRYDETRDCYVCPQGEELKLNARRHQRRGEIVRLYRASEESCAGCIARKRCLMGAKGRYRTLVIRVCKVKGMSSVTQRMREKIDTEIGRKKYEKRLPTVEPVFANICCNKGLRRFTFRGREKVSVQWMFYCLVHNIEKILHYGTAAYCR